MVRKSVLIIILISIVTIGFGQDIDETEKRAIKAFKEMDFKIAAGGFDELLGYFPNDTLYNYYKACCDIQTGVVTKSTIEKIQNAEELVKETSYFYFLSFRFSRFSICYSCVFK